MKLTILEIFTLRLLTAITEADEAYVIGKRGQYTPVGAYLAGDEIIKIAVEHGAQLIHPGQCGYREPLRRASLLTMKQVTVSCQKMPSSPETSRRLALS